MNISKNRKLGIDRGFTLVEVLVALGLFVFAVTALMGVIPVGMKQVQASSSESGALSLMESLRSDIYLALKSGMQTSPVHQIEISPSGTDIDLIMGEEGQIAQSTGNALYRISMKLRQPATGSEEPVRLHLRGTWPAAAPDGRESGSVELLSAFAP